MGSLTSANFYTRLQRLKMNTIQRLSFVARRHLVRPAPNQWSLRTCSSSAEAPHFLHTPIASDRILKVVQEFTDAKQSEQRKKKLEELLAKKAKGEDVGGDVESVVDQLVPSRVTTAQSNFTDDLGLDSLDVVELVIALEEEFGIIISNQDAETIHSVPDALDFFSRHPSAK
eukprot:NODE_2188_length_614_cov_228.725664_g1726_i0.p1 GENE.NODE_2188_length_614_cov_228.725664_g1726_i0~~NODE_2188_length_614_cov_228.725664_g1726_i0.p1  ORF type:complete len:172 (-),score=24.61 NODE_2188_length_614_cov_228.725664_g1726_i0:67-582(-)